LPFIKKALLYSTLLFSLVLIGLLSLPAHSSPVKPTTIKLQLFWHHQFEFAGFYAAIEQGYFDKYNIEVELLKYDPKLNPTNTVLTGEAQFGLAGADLIVDYHQGKDVKLLASYFKRSPLIIITQAEITSLKQIVNHKIYGDNKWLKQGSIRSMLNLFRIDPDKIKMTMAGESIELFRNKEIAGMLAYRTNIPYDLNQQNIPYRIYDPNQFGIASQDLNLFTTTSFAKENPELVRNFTLAANEGWRYAIEHSDELISLIKSKYNSQNKTKDALKFEAQEAIKLMSPELFTVGSVQKYKLITISQESFESKTISKIKNLDEFIFQHEEERRIDPDLFKLLTAEEIQYLIVHPEIRIQNDINYPPFNYLIDGKPSGYSVDLMNLIATMLEIKVKLISGDSWIEYKEMLKRNELDVLVNIIDLKSRHDFAGFTSPYADISTFAVSRTNEFSTIITKDSLIRKRIAITQGYAINKTLKTILPQSKFIVVKDRAEALKFISVNQADIYFEAGAVLDYYMAKNILSNLQLIPVSSDLNVINQSFSIVTHKENKILLNILQKTMNAIPDIEQIKLKRKWFVEHNKQIITNDSFSVDELNYIKQIPVTLCRPDLEDGAPLIIEVVDYITQTTGLKIKVSRPFSWSDSLIALQNKECDLLAGVTETAQRQKTMAFTSGYFRDKIAVVTKKEHELIYDLSDHLSHPFTIIKGLNVIKQLREHYPNINLIEVNTPLKGINLVKQGAAFGFIHPQVFANDLFNRYELSDLTINTSLRSQFDDIQAIATRKEDKLLHSILSKAVTNVDKEALTRLIHKKITSKTAIETAIQFDESERDYLNSTQVIWCSSFNANAWHELMSLLTQNTGMKLVQSRNMTWQEAISALNNEECDVLPGASATVERNKYMNFTQPIHQEERVIVTQNQQPFIADIRDYLDKEFVLYKGDILYELLKKGYPTIKTILVEHQKEGLTWVQNGKAFAYIGSITDTGSIMNEFSLKNLKIAGTLSDKYNDSWALATRKNDQILSGIFSKIINNTDEKKIRKSISGQLSVKYEKGFDYTLFWQMLFIVLVILTAIIFWNRRLAALNNQLKVSKKVAEEAQQKVECQNREILTTHQQLVQSEKMASLGTLTAGVAHEINNPTNFAHAAVFMMQNEIDEIKAFLKQLAGGDNADEKVIESFDSKFEKLIELTNTASEGTQRIKIIVEDLRTFARLDDAKQAKVHVSELITSTINLVHTQYENITIKTDFTYDPMLLCFPSKLNQVFMNIIVNACQSIKTKIKHNLQLNSNYKLEGLITISTSESGNYLVIDINDNGGGMDELTQQKVCEPFFTTKDVGSGTGLGMAISFGIIEEHDGMLKISSILSKGSDFSVYLPVENNSPNNKN